MLGTSTGRWRWAKITIGATVERPADRRGQLTRVALYQTQMQAVTLAQGARHRRSRHHHHECLRSGANAIGHAFDLVRSARRIAR
ncbi:MAG: hypothetical protein R3F11_12555 [Verrucomicrobiales bacterium]